MALDGTFAPIANSTVIPEEETVVLVEESIDHPLYATYSGRLPQQQQQQQRQQQPVLLEEPEESSGEEEETIILRVLREEELEQGDTANFWTGDPC